MGRWWLVAVTVAGCAEAQARPTTAEAQEERRAEFAEANAQREAARARARVGATERRAAPPVKVAAPEPSNAPREPAVAPETASLTPEQERWQSACAASTERRAKWPAAYLAIPEALEAHRAWRTEHCHLEDNAQMVVKTRQDHRGVLTQRVVPDRGVDTKCDGKPPPDPMAVVPPAQRMQVEFDLRMISRCAGGR